ncbi:hypothetical protein GN244_ATG20771 [Phytophthora infestans]|uniref:Uncharacterized protein n=1 Tax=Phytophthora infestans TaxID=4787 RepID=A0A833SD07_PHYIN|nr:hypothetical protein GN244_ATG20771 [Phytophthora infestans]
MNANLSELRPSNGICTSAQDIKSLVIVRNSLLRRQLRFKSETEQMHLFRAAILQAKHIDKLPGMHTASQ